MSDDDVDVPELQPPPPDRVARRALVFAAVTGRTGIEDDASNPDAEEFRKDVDQWLQRIGAAAEAEPMELLALQTPLGSLSDRDLIDGSWAWALGRYDLPPYDCLCGCGRRRR